MPTRATRDPSRATGNEVKDGTAGLGVATATPNLVTLAEAAVALESSSEGAGTRTRSGRVSKPPVRYEPVEQVEDDYAPEDYDTEDDKGDASEDIETESDEEEDESDADEDGNLDGFVVPDKSESDVSDSDEDGEPAVPVAKRRAVVKKRPAAARA